MTDSAVPKIVLTELAAADIDAVVEIEKHSFDRPWSRGLFLRELESAISRTTLAREAPPSHRVVGYICRWLILDEMQILNVAVHPDWRRRGVGRALMEEVLAEAREKGVRSVILEVRDGNANAVQLYSSLGFQRSGVRRDYYGQGRDGIVMTLRAEDGQT